jgi:hypothetical protein
VQTRIYDRLDGAQPNAPYFNSAAYSPDGRVWFANGQVVQMVDPSTLSRKALACADVHRIRHRRPKGIRRDRKSWTGTATA